ncbi:MAG TPA: hypothetical protein VNB22_13185 [Pyrinomonadaceae bacterium]|nr:hypothetical protein [Pyrinomonadaceae bacterium]
MKVSASPKFRILGFFLLLVIFCCAPVWSVEYFINQDGSAHLYSSFLMLELLKDNPSIGELFAFNSISVPNSSGHWLMVLFLNFFSPFVVTKIIVTLTFAGFIASIGWLRAKTVGTEGLKTSLLIGAAIGFNWLWFVGFYNFLIGVCCFVFTMGLFFSWREKINPWRTLILSMLFLLAYFSHIVSFAILAGSVLMLAFSASKPQIKRNFVCVLIALLPILPLVIIYKSVSVSGGGFFPAWRNLENPLSLVSWFSQIRTADPFILISRKSFPFIGGNSKYFAIFTPILWILTAIVSLATATFFEKANTNIFSKTNLIFVFLLVSCVLAAVFAPDDFGLTNGSVLRERLLLCGLVFFIPLFRAENSARLKKFAQICLLFVVIFQTAALWEYSLQTNAEAKEFLSAQATVSPDDKLASVVLVEDGLRFHSVPMPMMNNYLGIEQNRLVWDNYEIGHYLFPIVAKNPADKQFVFDFTQHNAFSLNNPGQNFAEKLSKLEACLAENNQKINTLLVWGKDSRVEAVLNKWFEPQPIYENGRMRVFRHKP